MQKLMGDEGGGGACFSLLTPSICGFMLTLTRHEIHHAHKYPNTNNYSHSYTCTYFHDNTTLGARKQIPSSFKHCLLSHFVFYQSKLLQVFRNLSNKKVSEYDHDIPQFQTAVKPVAS